jgi:16S rRNA (adenine1518-N6/adenine1519-N6)-dimethyltransferase
MPSKPKLGQNFLVDAEAAARIVAALGDVSQRTVVEIGPGRGAITGLLIGRARHVIAVELDRAFAAELRMRFTPEQVTVVEQDVLGFDFAALEMAVLDSAVLMVQREVAARVAAAPGTRDYGSLSVMVQMHGPVEPLFTLPPASFSPPPEVHSAVFRWRFAPRFAELGVEADPFLRFVRQAFAQKRKTLQNNLRAAGFLPAVTASAIAQAGIDIGARAEAVSIPAFAALWRSLHSTQASPEAGA